MLIELVLCPRAVLKCEKLWSVRKAVRYALVVTRTLCVWSTALKCLKPYDYMSLEVERPISEHNSKGRGSQWLL